MIRIIYIAIAILTLGGCTGFQPQVRPQSPITLPDKYSLYTTDAPGPSRWWEALGSPELNQLVNDAQAENFDILTAWARIKQARAVANQAGAELNPDIEYNGGAKKSLQQIKQDSTGTSHENNNTFTTGLAAAYELDLWGKLDALRRSELLEVTATREDLEIAVVSVSAQVVSTWIDILSMRQQIQILKGQVDINQRMLELQKLRFMNGKADALDISQQREALTKAKAILPTLQLEEQKQLNALAVLLGLAGTGTLSISQIQLPELIPLPPTGLPADLLARRPDIRAAGLRLKAADWQVSAARADRLPSVTLSAEAAFSSGSLELLLNNWVSTLAANITGPLFDGGYRSAEVEKSRAKADESLTDYARTVAEAIQEVEDSLITEKRQKEYIALLEDQLKATRVTLKDANIQYMNGQDNYLNYLTAWTSVQQLERQLVDEQATLIKNRVSLYRALGGDWSRQWADRHILNKTSHEMESVLDQPQEKPIIKS